MSVDSVELHEGDQKSRQWRVVDATECTVHLVHSTADSNEFHQSRSRDGCRSSVREVVDGVFEHERSFALFFFHVRFLMERSVRDEE
jgi:hypothetical protein